MATRHSRQSLTQSLYFRRVARSLGLIAILTVPALAAGTAGYHYWGELAWIDSLLNASMVPSGMGPVVDLHTTGGKLFAAG